MAKFDINIYWVYTVILKYPPIKKIKQKDLKILIPTIKPGYVKSTRYSEYPLPFKGYVQQIEPDKGLAQIQSIMKNPRCNKCHRAVKYGYRYCDSHREICSVCNNNESTMRINNRNKCDMCLRR